MRRAVSLLVGYLESSDDGRNATDRTIVGLYAFGLFSRDALWDRCREREWVRSGGRPLIDCMVNRNNAKAWVLVIGIHVVRLNQHQRGLRGGMSNKLSSAGGRFMASVLGKRQWAGLTGQLILPTRRKPGKSSPSRSEPISRRPTPSGRRRVALSRLTSSAKSFHAGRRDCAS